MDNKIQKELTKNILFQGIRPESIERILHCSNSKIKHYQSGKFIYRQEEQPTKLFVLLEGTVHIIKSFSSGRKSILFSVTAGNVFGENSLFEKSGYQHDAEASTDIRLLEIPWKFFHCFCNSSCDHHRQLVQNMLEILSHKEALIEKRFHIANAPSIRARIAIWLLDSAGGNNVLLRMNREELADFLGIPRPSLSRELMRMQEDGLLKIEKKKIQIVNREMLESLYC